MNLSERISMARVNDNNEAIAKERAKQEHEKEVLENIKALTPRITKLIEVGNELLDNGYWEFLDPGEWGRKGFVSEGWAHHFGFVLDCWAVSKKHISSMGIVNGGGCGSYDFHTTGEHTYMTEWYKSEPCGKAIKIEDAERMLEVFDDFEKRFYESLEVFLAKKGV